MSLFAAHQHQQEDMFAFGLDADAHHSAESMPLRMEQHPGDDVHDDTFISRTNTDDVVAPPHDDAVDMLLPSSAIPSVKQEMMEVDSMQPHQQHHHHSQSQQFNYPHARDDLLPMHNNLLHVKSEGEGLNGVVDSWHGDLEEGLPDASLPLPLPMSSLTMPQSPTAVNSSAAMNFGLGAPDSHQPPSHFIPTIHTPTTQPAPTTARGKKQQIKRDTSKQKQQQQRASQHSSPVPVSSRISSPNMPPLQSMTECTYGGVSPDLLSMSSAGSVSAHDAFDGHPFPLLQSMALPMRVHSGSSEDASCALNEPAESRSSASASGNGSGRSSSAGSSRTPSQGSGASEGEDDLSEFDAIHSTTSRAAAGNKKAKSSSSATASNATKKSRAGRKRKMKSSSSSEPSSGNSSSTEQESSNHSTRSMMAAGVGEEQATGGSNDGSESSSSNTNTPAPPIDKRLQRLQRNRASAQLSRERKKQYITLLEFQVKELSELNANLTHQIECLTNENISLKDRLERLNIREKVQQRREQAQQQQQQRMNHGNMNMSMQSSPLSSSTSDTDSIRGCGSAPDTPVRVDTEAGDMDDAPIHHPAKKLKVASCSSRAGSPLLNGSGGSIAGAPFNARTGMLLFTLMMSVGLIYTCMENVGPAGSGSGPHPFVQTGFDLSGPGVSSSVPMSMPSLTRDSTSSALTSTMPARGRVLASIADSESEGGSGVSDAFALVPLATSGSGSGRSTPSTIKIEEVEEDDSSSKALDVYSPRRKGHDEMDVEMQSSNHQSSSTSLKFSASSHLAAAAASQLLRQLVNQGALNLSTSDENNVIFCPQAITITKQVWHEIQAWNESSTSDDAAAHAHIKVKKEADVATPSDLTERRMLTSGHGGGGGGGDELAIVPQGLKRSRSGVAKRSASSSRGSSPSSPAVLRLRNAIAAPMVASSSTPALPAPHHEQQRHVAPLLSGSADGNVAHAQAQMLLGGGTGLTPSNVESKLQVGDKLLLWLPLHGSMSSNSNAEESVRMHHRSNHTDHASSSNSNNNKSGLVEVACHISHVRPVLLS